MRNLEYTTPFDLSRLVAGIQNGDADAARKFYDSFGWLRGYFASRIMPQEADDHYHDLIMAVLASIRKGSLREPSRLARYPKMTALNIASERIRVLSLARARELPESWSQVADTTSAGEALAISRQVRTIVSRVLQEMPERHRAVLVRFYVEEQEPQQICADLKLSATQFRLIKSRAKARLTELVHRRIKRSSIDRETCPPRKARHSIRRL